MLSVQCELTSEGFEFLHNFFGSHTEKVAVIRTEDGNAPNMMNTEVFLLAVLEKVEMVVGKEDRRVEGNPKHMIFSVRVKIATAAQAREVELEEIHKKLLSILGLAA